MIKNQDRLGKIKRFYRDRGRLPSLAEVADLLGFKSRNAAKYLVDGWVDEGVIERDERGRLAPGRQFRSLKILGTVVAGFPSPAEEEEADTISLDDWLIDNKESSFMLKVSGDSMIDVGIMPGDMVILDRGRQAKDGDIVVAEIDKQWTVKTFEKRGNSFRLLPANKKYRPIEPQDELRIAGVVSAVVRKLKVKR